MEEEISLDNIEKAVEKLQAMRDKCIYCGQPKEKSHSHLWTGDCIRVLKEKLKETEAYAAELERALDHWKGK